MKYLIIVYTGRSWTIAPGISSNYKKDCLEAVFNFEL